MEEILRNEKRLEGGKTSRPKLADEKAPERRKKLQEQLHEDGIFGNLLTQDILLCRSGVVKSTADLEWGGVFQRPLHLACLLGHYEVVKTLLVVGEADINSRNSSLETPLSVACRAKRLGVVKLLLDKDAIPNKPDDIYNTPWDYLVRRGVYPEWDADPTEADLKGIVESFLQKLPAITSAGLRTALRVGNITMMKVILSIEPQGVACLDDQDEDGWTALHFGVQSGQLEVVESLLAKGAKCNVLTTEPFEADALTLAVWFGHAAIEAEIRRHQSSQSSTFESRKTQCVDFNASWFSKLGHSSRIIDELPTSKLIFGNSKEHQQFLKKGEDLYFHFPANNVSFIRCLGVMWSGRLTTA